ncbi:MAG TPA: adenosylcobinamide-GDP ribazoletransferase, partial [Actinomycetes bacterium]|nr:adenosylcobinamide-GDP ribazoletransferase [Actinomycetes bacterium]
MTDALRLAFGTLSVIPVGLPRDVDHRTWGRSMIGAPVVGVVLGMVAAAVAIGLLELGASPLMAGVAAVATLALLTRALHLDGLADVADGLGSGRSPVDAR